MQSHVTFMHDMICSGAPCLIHMRHGSFVCAMTHSEGGMWVLRGSFHSLVVHEMWLFVAVRCSVLPGVAACCSQGVELIRSCLLQRCNALQRTTACCNEPRVATYNQCVTTMPMYNRVLQRTNPNWSCLF